MSNILSQGNLVAWCIVPYDKLNRSPKERIAMLKELHISQYAYDWRPEHLPSVAEELRLSQQENIRVTAVWMWLDGDADRGAKLGENNQAMLDHLRQSGLRTTLWLGFNSNFFDGLDHAGKVERAVERLRFLRSRLPENVSGIGLYNHGGWFGEPENQIEILESLDDPSMGIVYNFHHAHPHIERFPELMKKMAPWLRAVNLNGMGTEASRILPIGSGEHDLAMVRVLKQSGFRGTVGILGHIEDEDVKLVLQRNLAGLRELERRL